MTLIRPARPDEMAALREVDRASMDTFAAAGISLPEGDGLLSGDLVLVADHDDEPVGLALVTVHSGWWHLEEISVLPSHGRQGIGTLLVEDVIARAAAAGAPGVTLTTFRDVPFNGPWYARLGFAEVPEDAHPWLAEARRSERARGIDVAPRCAMARPS